MEILAAFVRKHSREPCDSEALAGTVREDRVYLPNAASRTIYDDGYHTYRETYDALVPTFMRRTQTKAVTP